MHDKSIRSVVLVILLASLSSLAHNIGNVNGQGSIYIRSDGSIDPPTPLIQRVGEVYTLMGNIADAIWIERDAIALDGASYTVSGAIFLWAGHVTLRNVHVNVQSHWLWDIYVSSDYNTISGNIIEGRPLNLSHADYNTITRNNFTGTWGKLVLHSDSSHNTIYHNNFLSGAAYFPETKGQNVWDDGYPSGGNYWSSYTGVDEKHGPNQDQPGSDGIGDTPYTVGGSALNIDRYPLMPLWTSSDTVPPYVSVLSPQNKTYTIKNVPLEFYLSEPVSWIGYSLDNEGNVTINGNTTSTGLADGRHSIVVYANDTAKNTGASKKVFFSVDTVAPIISILSPEYKKYTTRTVPLTFIVDQKPAWMGYSLDDSAYTTITGNTTLTKLEDGFHSLIVYANDTAGNMGASETVNFTVDTQMQEPSQGPPFEWFIIGVLVTIVVVETAGLGLYRRQRTSAKPTERKTNSYPSQ